MKLLQRTHESKPRYFFEGKRVDNQTFRNLLRIAVNNRIEPVETKDGEDLIQTNWNLELISHEQIKEAKFKANKA